MKRFMNKEFYSVDRIEDGVAVLEFPDKTFKEVDISLLPSDIKEGNILTKNEKSQFIHDFDEEKVRKQRLLDLQNKIFG